jgi:hypothetical protein
MLKGRGLICGRGTYFSLRYRMQACFGPAQEVPKFLSPGQGGREVKLSTEQHLVPRLRMVEHNRHSLIYLQAMMLKQRTGMS